ncbi:hypothetical protein AALP_AA2G069400 [Arabis alpina]|uniref:Uncharacterized protein n=1 Tax=Arabis alpina TaxID=50452 RepID=A0A087HFS7_ARAAL|nr:hypothetical protein AALP_AA2G069400 [Arabis alpina]
MTSSSLLLTASPPSTSLLPRHRHRLPLRGTFLFSNSSRTQVSIDTSEEADKLVDKIDFGELCNDFECTSSPQVESTARQLARDILELREGNRAFACYAVSVRYKDPIRSFAGREKYKRPLWITRGLENPTVTIQEMVMLSTSVLRIRWTIKGIPKSLLAVVSGDLIIKVKSEFTLNQISGQVIEHQESWDSSSSSPIAQVYFWTSRRLFAASESAKDLLHDTKDLTATFTTPKEDTEIYRDPTDPTKFFQRDDSFERDVYQVALFLALVYFVVQFLRNTL